MTIQIDPHAHIQMNTRKLLRLENGEVIFGEKGRDWGRRNFLYYYRENVAYFINQYLEKYGHLAKVSHLSHKARGIDLIPTIHEGTAWYIKDSKLKLTNVQILKENAAKIRENLESREISKQLVVEDLTTENVKESPVQDLTILADGSRQDSEVSSTTSTVEEFNNFSHCL
ncbi:MobA/MobL family protein [Candidatus Tisiphia endosymbiont of Oplodontha viridula]|uniref:MobA/MobL family protein n=1 Tax=Candidatus Tisiphia endosymbiont of Oplodontha viridula TaxID=3077925 RepID=UPI0035C8D71C